MGLIQDITVGSNVTQVDIDLTSTPLIKGELYEMTATLVNGTASNSNIDLFVNDNVTATNYYHQRLVASNVTVASARDNNAQVTSVDDLTTTVYKCYIKLTNSGEIVAISNSLKVVGGTTPALFNHAMSSTVTFSSITKLSLIASVSNAIGINSRIQLSKIATKVDEVIVGSAVTQIDFTGLDIGKGNEYLLVSDILSVNDASTSNMGMFFNDDLTPTNYDAQQLFADGSSVSGTRYNSAYYSFVSANTRALSISKITLPNSGLVNVQTDSILKYGGNTSQLLKLYSSKRATVSSITKISLVAVFANAIDTTSRFELYKLI